MIKITSLSRNYGDFKAVDGVSFEITRGEVVGLLGHNGAGKTTIMKMMTGYLEPTLGTIEIDGMDIADNLREVQARIGYLPENCPVWPEMTVLEYLEYQAHLHNVEESDIPAAVAKAVRRTALQAKATARIQTLSRGYQQRVGVAQAILHEPDIIILDEPTNGLDPTQIFQMRQLIKELAQTSTVIISTHILQEVQAVCERVLIMRAGKLVVDARIRDLQKGHQMAVTLSNGDASYLNEVDGVASVVKKDTSGDRTSYLLDCQEQVAPEIVAAVTRAGDKLYGLHPVVRNLETLFAEVNEATITAA